MFNINLILKLLNVLVNGLVGDFIGIKLFNLILLIVDDIIIILLVNVFFVKMVKDKVFIFLVLLMI